MVIFSDPLSICIDDCRLHVQGFLRNKEEQKIGNNSNVFCSSLGQIFKTQRKKVLPIPMYIHFGKVLAISNYKKRTTGINTYTLTLNKNSIFKQFLTLSYHKKAP